MPSINTPVSLVNGPTGAGPAGGLIQDSSGTLFGTTENGGPSGVGTVFEVQNGVVTTLAPFASSTGANPVGGVVEDSSGNLFGTTRGGGASNQGTVFELQAGNNTVTTLASFSNTVGGDPRGGLIEDSSGNLFGTTVGGGSSNQGTVFEVRNSSGTVTTLATFNGTNGAYPSNGLVEDASGNLFGTVGIGGGSGVGTVFEVKNGSGTITTLVTFNGGNGSIPNAGLIEDASGNLFGTTSSGGATNDGTVFKVSSGSGILTTLASFNGTNGKGPSGSLIEDGSGNLFGTTYQGGASNDGVVFEVRSGSGAITPLAVFTGANGMNPQSNLVEDTSGNLFGTTSNGGAFGQGTVFEVPARTSPVIPPTILAPWTVNHAGFSQTISASGGTGTLTFSHSGGLPPGLSLNSQGVLSGTPMANGNFLFNVGVTDSLGASTNKDIRLTINPTVILSHTPLASWTINQVGYNQTLSASGGTGAKSYNQTSGTLPTGLTLSSNGVLSGTPIVAGRYTFSVVATDTVGATDMLSYSVTINAALSITTTTLANWTVNQGGYSQALGSTGGTGPLIYSKTGTLPLGLTLSSAGVLSGQPSATGSYAFTLMATDTLGASGSRNYTIVINPAVTITTASLTGGPAGMAYNQTVSASGGTGAMTFSAPAAGLPPGLTLSGAGLLSGNPTSAGGYTFAVTATDSAGASGSKSFTVAVNPGTAVKLSFVQQPVNTPTGVTLPQVTVQVLDAYGNVVTSDNTDTVTIGIAGGPGSFTAGSTTTATVVNGVATFNSLTVVVPGSYTLSEVVPTLYTGLNSTAFKVAPLQVVPGSFAGTPSGFSLQFNAPYLVNSLTPVLFGQGFGATAPAPSAIITTDPGNLSDTVAYVEGSLVLNPATNSITFVATNTAYEANTGSPVLPDGIYTVILRGSAATNGFQALNGGGGFLDGLMTGGAGSGDFKTSFTVHAAAAHDDVVWVPATADGPGQALSAPGMNQAGGGYPIYLDDSTGSVTNVQVTVNYDPALLTVTGVSGAKLSLLASSTPGHALLQYSGPVLPSGSQTPLGFLMATVPGGSTANPTPYKAKDLLHLSGVSVNGGAVPVTTSDALHLVAYVGDADGNGSYSSNDAVLITRVALQTDTGFAAYPLVDPVIVADTDGSGFIPADAPLQANDAGVGFPTANLTIPPVPSGVHFQAIANNVDPSLSIPGDLQVAPDGTLVVPVNIDDAHPEGSTGLVEAHLALTYDPRQFRVSAADVHLGSLLAAGSGWSAIPTIDPVSGQIAIALSSTTPVSCSAGGSLVTIDFHPTDNSQPGSVSSRTAAFALVGSVTANGEYIATELEDAQGTFTLSPVPTNGFDPRIDGLVRLPATPAAPPTSPAPAEITTSVTASIHVNEIAPGDVSFEETTGTLMASTTIPSKVDGIRVNVNSAASAEPVDGGVSAAHGAAVIVVVSAGNVGLLGIAPWTGPVFQTAGSLLNGSGAGSIPGGQHLADPFFQVLEWQGAIDSMAPASGHARRERKAVPASVQQTTAERAALDQYFAQEGDDEESTDVE